MGDLGTILPLAVGMILVNGLDPAGVFFSFGVFYILCGVYFGITVPVQPMKVIGAYAVATGISASQISASGLMMAGFLLLVGWTGLIDLIGKVVPRPVIRGVQLSTGILLMVKGVELVFGNSAMQAAAQACEPYLRFQVLWGIPISLIIGTAGMCLTLLLLDNRKLPAALVVISLGVVFGLVAGTGQGFDSVRLGIHLPEWMPGSWPVKVDFGLALMALVLPQLPMTLGNAVIANADLSREYFGDGAKRVTYKNTCLSMAVGNAISFCFGGMPMCHGAGGLAAHYRFGARTAGSNLMIGAILIILVILFGHGILALCYLIPLSILGVLLIFSGTQLAMTMLDLHSRKDLFVTLFMLGITLASNLGIAFALGIGLSHLLRSKHLSV